MNDSPAVMQDFVFGALESDANTLDAQRRQWSGLRHMHAIDPLDPQPGQPVTLTVTVGRDAAVDHVAAYVTVDGSIPEGSRGQASNGFTVDFQRTATLWQPLYWDYAEIWQGVIPAQLDGAFVRYLIEGWHSAYPHPLPFSQRGRGARLPSPKGRGAGGEGESSSPPTSLWANELRIDGTSEPATLYGYSVDRFETPAWAREAIVYQIFLDRFAPVESRWLEPEEMEVFHGGTLRGVIDHLDYIASLGVTTVWLTPIFKTGSYHGYDTIDYFEVDPRFGDKADLLELVQGAHARGLRVLLDFVANHSSDQFAPFQAALHDRDSVYRSWFSFGSQYDHGYRCFFTAATMPQFDHDDPGARGYLLDAARYWLREFGVDGYRLDYAAGPSHDFWSAFGRACKEENPDCWLFGEVTRGSDWLRTYTGRLDGCLDFSFVRQIRLLCAPGKAAAPLGSFAAFLDRTQHFFPASYTRPAFIDNHDMNRLLWSVGGDKGLLRLAAGLLMAFGSSPILYYGTEVGLGQPRAKGHYREEARHPMLWGDAQDRQLLGWFRDLIAFRRAHPALVYGPVTTHLLDDASGLWLAERAWQGDHVLIAVNNGTHPHRIALPQGAFMDAAAHQETSEIELAARSIKLLAMVR
ncbi:MAG: DUF3459 domain-containing protein [Anaerolineae bacterium]|nr:DUF3459 domain-containing protein [Anaerolineae bacterium]